MRFRPSNINDRNETASDDKVVDHALDSMDSSAQELHINIRRHYLKMAGRDGVIKPTKQK